MYQSLSQAREAFISDALDSLNCISTTCKKCCNRLALSTLISSKLVSSNVGLPSDQLECWFCHFSGLALNRLPLVTLVSINRTFEKPLHSEQASFFARFAIDQISFNPELDSKDSLLTKENSCDALLHSPLFTAETITIDGLISRILQWLEHILDLLSSRPHLIASFVSSKSEFVSSLLPSLPKPMQTLLTSHQTMRTFATGLEERQEFVWSACLALAIGHSLPADLTAPLDLLNQLVVHSTSDDTSQ